MKSYKRALAFLSLTAVGALLPVAPSVSYAERGPWERFLQGVGGTATLGLGGHFLLETFRIETMAHDISFARRMLLQELSGRASADLNSIEKELIHRRVTQVVDALKKANSRKLLGKEGKDVLQTFLRYSQKTLSSEDLQALRGLKAGNHLFKTGVVGACGAAATLLTTVGTALLFDALFPTDSYGATPLPESPAGYVFFSCDVGAELEHFHHRLEVLTARELVAIYQDPAFTAESLVYFPVKNNINDLLSRKWRDDDLGDLLTSLGWTPEIPDELDDEFRTRERDGSNDALRRDAERLCAVRDELDG